MSEGNTVGESLDGRLTVGSPVGNSDGSAVVGEEDGTLIGCAEIAKVGRGVGGGTNTWVGLGVGFRVGSLVGLDVGLASGGAALDTIVSPRIRIASNATSWISIRLC
jgi:hypothetical protein